MSKYYGKIGYGEQVDTGHGVWKPQIVERNYYGDVLRNSRRFESSGQQNDDLTISNEISIVADAYAYEHFHNMRYITWMGTRWKVSSVSVQRPRLVLTLGGEWNGPETMEASGYSGANVP